MSHKLLLTLIILLIILILFITSKENFNMLPPDSSVEMTYYKLDDLGIIDGTLSKIKDSIFERNKYWSFITPTQEFNGTIPKIQDINDKTKTKIKENNIYYKSDNKDDDKDDNIVNFTYQSNQVENSNVLRLIGSIRIKYIHTTPIDINKFLGDINITFTPKKMINEIEIENENEIKITKYVKYQKPTYYINKDDKLNKINTGAGAGAGATLNNLDEVLIIFNDNINLEINTPNISFNNPNATLERINDIEVYGKDLNSIINQLRYIDNISIILTKLIFTNMTSQLLCFGNSGTVGIDKTDFKLDTDLTQIDSQSRIWIDSFIDEEIFNSEGDSLIDIKIKLKDLIDKKNSDYFDCLNDLLVNFPDK